jgi:hypothetical protein
LLTAPTGAGPPPAQWDAIWKRGKSDETAEALRSVVNAGYRRSATVGRVEMNGSAARLIRFPVCAPAVIAGIGILPDTIMDRAVVVRMRRRAPDERVRDYRERTTRPEGDALRELLAKWAADVADRAGDPWPQMPPGWPTARPMCGNRCSWSRTLRPGGLAQQLTGIAQAGTAAGIRRSVHGGSR